ncbi:MULTISPECIES: ISL3 family transposase [Brevibacterium]|uniref:Transposase n=3 Tax=Brevibacterium TaxID=1696 RepID=A0A1H1SA03_BRESA|nr:ISL3 family transposase [Brevibacterium sandarakinum]SDS44794.1 Transposase [Brevibacterium sandarakinum]
MQSTSSAQSCPVADVICRTLELGIHITGAHITDDDVTVIEATPREPAGFCPDCGAEGRLRDHVIRHLTDVPITGHPTRLHVRLPRYQCVHPQCRRSIFQHPLEAAEPGAKTTKRATTWILKRLIHDQMSIQAISKALGLGWDLVNHLAINAAKSLVYADPDHLSGVRVLGIDEHCWKHVRGQGEDSFATIFVDLTPLIDGTGRARLLDVKAGRSARVVTTWLNERSPAFRAGVEVVTMDGFAGYHTATMESLPESTPVMDPFHVVQLAGQKLTACRQRLQQQIHGHRGRKKDLLYRGRRTLLTRRSLLNKRATDRLERLWAEHDDHVALEVTYLVYQDVIDAYEHPDRKTGRRLMQAVIESLRRGLPKGLEELAQLGRTLWRKQAQVLAFFDRGGASNGPVEAINGRLEHLRGIGLGFRNFEHYVLRCLLHSGQLSARVNAL